MGINSEPGKNRDPKETLRLREQGQAIADNLMTRLAANNPKAKIRDLQKMLERMEEREMENPTINDPKMKDIFMWAHVAVNSYVRDREKLLSEVIDEKREQEKEQKTADPDQ